MSELTAQVSSSMEALMKEYEIITHNLANVSTVGFKRRSNAFTKALDDQNITEQSYKPGEVELSTAFDFSQGTMTETGREMDFALMGKGFFVIETPDGPLYTRNGTFSTNQSGQIVDLEGRTVAGESGVISVPRKIAVSDIFVDAYGTISAQGRTLGKFKLVDFGDDDCKLAPVGNSCFKMTDEDIQPEVTKNIMVKQGYLEGSNVHIIEELVDMIMVTRMYEANTKFLEKRSDASNSLMNIAMG